jgi:hypothetical protein
MPGDLKLSTFFKAPKHSCKVILPSQNRLKPILQNIISQTQKGFLRGRYIGECVRIISDLMDKLEEEDIPDLLMLVDFEKATQG